MISRWFRGVLRRMRFRVVLKGSIEIPWSSYHRGPERCFIYLYENGYRKRDIAGSCISESSREAQEWRYTRAWALAEAWRNGDDEAGATLKSILKKEE